MTVPWTITPQNWLRWRKTKRQVRNHSDVLYLTSVFANNLLYCLCFISSSTAAHELAFLNDIDSGGNPTYNRSSVPSSSHSNVVKQSEVLCPVCKKRWLYQRGAIIICRCGFSLDTLNGITIEHLQTQLAESFQEHVDTGCTGSLEYEVLNLTSDTPDSDEANVSMDRQCQNLLATCSQCDYMSVVI